MSLTDQSPQRERTTRTPGLARSPKGRRQAMGGLPVECRPAAGRCGAGFRACWQPGKAAPRPTRLPLAVSNTLWGDNQYRCPICGKPTSTARPAAPAELPFPA